MDDDGDRLFYLGMGPLAAILLGVCLMPLRGLTVASNFTFAFLALTIVVGEFGGRVPAVGTALVSALSLDFFLTRPYLRLAMADKNDVVAFAGLAACGLLAAALGTPRRARHHWRQRTALVDAALRQIESGGYANERAQRIADAARAVLPLAAVVVRDDDGAVVAASGPAAADRPEPACVVSTSAVAEADAGGWRGNAPLASDGVRVALLAGARPAGWLDAWGDGRPAGREARRTLAAVARALAATLDASRRPPHEDGRPLSPWAVGRRYGSA